VKVHPQESEGDMEKSTMNTKLVINMNEGTVQVEGAEEFVRFVYQDFKDHLSKGIPPRTKRVPALEHMNDAPPLLSDKNTPQRKRVSRKAGSPDGSGARTAAYKPKFNTALDLNGLEKFYDSWKPENNFEKILIFAVFLRESLGARFPLLGTTQFPRLKTT
jgi:hypothetical protein